jgi:hypothetical protein
MSKRKYPPITGLGGHEIRRVFGLSCVSKKSLDPVEVPPSLPSRCPKVAVQEELGDSVEVPKWGWAQGMGRTRIKVDDSVEVPKKVELQQSRSQNLEKVEVPKRLELQTSRSQKGTQCRGPMSGCRAATALHRVGETCSPPGGTGWVAGSGDSVAKEWRNRVLRSLAPFALPSVACPLSLPSRLFSLSLSLQRPSLRSLSLVSDHT